RSHLAQIPVRSHDLLGDDQPLDDRAGARLAETHSSPDAATETDEPNAAGGGRRFERAGRSTLVFAAGAHRPPEAREEEARRRGMWNARASSRSRVPEWASGC